GSILPDRLHRTGVHRLLTLRVLLGGLRLAIHVRVALLLAPLEVARRRHAADVAVDALAVDVERARHVLHQAVLGIGHEGGTLARARVPNEDGLKARYEARAWARLPRVRHWGAAAVIGCVVAAFLGALACRPNPLPESGSGDRDAVAGRRIYERKCASC